jgi:hypothetical protein
VDALVRVNVFLPALIIAIARASVHNYWSPSLTIRHSVFPLSPFHSLLELEYITVLAFLVDRRYIRY